MMQSTVKDVILDTFKNLDNLKDETINTIKEYYWNYESNGEYWLNNNEKNLLEIYNFLANNNLDVLDVGSGSGSEAITFFLRGSNVTGVEIKKDRINAAIDRFNFYKNKSDNNKIDFIKGSIFNIKKKFDIVWLNQAFHHIEPREKFLEKLNHLVKPGGHVIFAESNAMNPLIQFGCFRMRGFKTIRTITLDDGTEIPYGDERVLSASSLTNKLKHHGFKKESLRYYQILPNNKNYKKFSFIERFIYLPSFLFAKYVLVVRKSD